MKVWEVQSDVENFAAIHLTGNAETILDLYEYWPYFEGQKFGDTWPKYLAKFKTLNASGSFKRAVGNFVDMDSGILVCDNTSLIKLKKLILNEVEILSIDVEGFNMKVLNIINIIDCLDEKKVNAYTLKIAIKLCESF
ncbi:MAG: hypothetical protein SWX82_09970 [Cyanobacteriota bacterium]|nr:hypothetical protein [Cyanobacteriota bacterium]